MTRDWIGIRVSNSDQVRFMKKYPNPALVSPDGPDHQIFYYEEGTINLPDEVPTPADPEPEDEDGENLSGGSETEGEEDEGNGEEGNEETDEEGSSTKDLTDEQIEKMLLHTGGGYYDLLEEGEVIASNFGQGKILAVQEARQFLKDRDA